MNPATLIRRMNAQKAYPPDGPKGRRLPLKELAKRKWERLLESRKRAADRRRKALERAIQAASVST